MIEDFFGKLDDILYKPVEVVCDYIKEPLNTLHAKQKRKDDEHAAGLEMQKQTHEAELQRENARVAAELELKMRSLNADLDAEIARREDERRDRLVEAIKRYQIDLATASRDIVNSVGVMSLELRERANDMVRENTEKYRQMQRAAQQEADERLALIQERYANNERIRIRMEDAVINQMESTINTADEFIKELAADIKRMNENADKLMEIQMQGVNAYLQPMAAMLQSSPGNEDNVTQIEYQSENVIDSSLID